ncbi:hypothetical protein D3C71_1759250 [compost metagenome]
MQVKFLYGATIFENDGSKTEIEEGQLLNVVRSFNDDGYYKVIAKLNGVDREFIYDSDDMKLVEE